MKKIVCSLLTVGCAVSAFAQEPAFKGRWFVGANFKAGMLNEKIAVMPASWIYTDALNNSRSDLKIDNEISYGFDVQLGFYFSPNRKWGISTGVVYMMNDATVTRNSLRFEYRSLDGNGDVFRQRVTTARPIVETIQTTNISIPILLKYRTMLSKKIGFTMDAGVLYNVKIETDYNAKASFNYEAIYKFERQSDGQYVTVYDDAAIPDADDWMITLEQYNKDKGDGNEAAYFNSLRAQGYNVGLNQEAASSGTISHKTGSLGLLLQPSLNFMLSKAVALNVGPYLMVQKFRNEPSMLRTMTTDKIGTYSTMLNNTAARRNTNYGLNLGLSVSF